MTFLKMVDGYYSKSPVPDRSPTIPDVLAMNQILVQLQGYSERAMKDIGMDADAMILILEFMKKVTSGELNGDVNLYREEICKHGGANALIGEIFFSFFFPLPHFFSFLCYLV